MPQTVSELMTRDPVSCPPDTSIATAAGHMRDRDTGDVVVVADGVVQGIVTDRDIVVRAIADGRGPDTPLSDVLTGEVVTVAPDALIEAVEKVMRDHAVRRVPVVEDGRLAGVVSIGDLAIERDSDSALADISAARETT